MRYAGGELAQRSELLRLDQPVLRGPQILKRSLQIACLGTDFVEQPDILDGDDGLICEGPEELDLLFAEELTSERRITITPIASSSRISGVAAMEQ